MSGFAPRWALNAQAIDSAGNSHLAKGIHLRVIPSQLLGLPAIPFLVYRTNLFKEGKGGNPRNDITWIDSRGTVLTAPFDVSPDNPVTGWLPPATDGICCWIDVIAEPFGFVIPKFPVAFPSFSTAARRPKAPSFSNPTRSEKGPRLPAGTPGRAIEIPGPINPRAIPEFKTFFKYRGFLRVDAILQTPRGPAVIASALRPPYQLGASRIERVVVSGRGRVYSAVWVDARRLLKQFENIWRPLPLPVSGGARYTGIPNADVEAMNRVKRGAPLRFGLHDEPFAPNPASTSPATPADEEARINSLSPPVLQWVKRLVDDTSAPPEELAEPQDVFDEFGKHLGKTNINLLGAVFNAALDPGMGRWLGFMDVDDAPLSDTPGEVQAYLVRGIWRVDRDKLGGLFNTLPKESFIQVKDVRNTIRSTAKVKAALQIAEGSYVDIWTVACATVANPPASPAPPQLQSPEYGPWLPATPPAARREIILPATGMLPGSLVALARRKGSTITGLNPRNAAGRALPLTPAVPDNATSAGSGEFTDRQAPPEAISYRAAQTDWFGRWSNWTERAAAAGIRPRPPQPVVQAFYNAPAFGDPVPAGPLSGTLQIRVSVPPVSALAPGSRLLAFLRIDVDGVMTTAPLPSPPAPPEVLETTISGPAIERTGHRTVQIRAQWMDSSSAVSLFSEPVTLELYDPRPPEPVTIPPTLKYAARPDVTGNARVELNWNASSAQRRFRVFYANETGIISRFQKMVANDEPDKPRAETILSALASAATLLDRAGVFESNADFLRRELFEQITDRPLESGGATQVRFTHAVSGSLRVLSLYRVVAISQSNVEAPFEEGPLVPVAVPNTGPPPQPLLTVEPLIDLTAAVPFRARLTIRVPQGLVPAIEYRLRRSVTKSGDFLQMPVVATGSIPLPAGEEMQVVEFTDEGVSEIAPSGKLKPWTTYYWRVEVRGGPEPGGGPTGQWSNPGAPTSVMLVMPDPPLAANAVTVTASGSGAEIRWQHPEPLIGGSLGGYSLDLYRKMPGDREKFLVSISADAPPAAGGRSPDRSGDFHFTDSAVPVAAGTEYRVIVTDPIGRNSPPSATATL